jgi:predicted Fe-S protein YdhL (DUF1289 family)
MAPDNGLCVGCLRTIDEIAHWSSLSVPQRHRVWQAIAQRAAPQPGA